MSPGEKDPPSAAYARELAAWLGGRQPLDILAATPAALTLAVEGLADAQLRRPEAPGKWSVIEVVQHLADVELVLGFRLRLILAEPTPTLTAMNQDLWARELGYGRVALADAQEQFRLLRAANLRLVRSVEPARLDRIGIHAERGPESARDTLALYAGHDARHLAQIARIRRAIGA